MFSLRHAAARLLTSRSVSVAARPRTITTFISISARPSRLAAPAHYQRRWASAEAEAKKDSESAPISELQPTPQDEVENAIHEDHAAADTTASDAKASASSEETPEVKTTNPATTESADAAEQATLDSAMNASNAAHTQQAPTADVTDSSSSPISEMTRDVDRTRSAQEAPTPKPTIYVGNLFFDVTENDLQKEFSRFGTIKSVRLIKDVRGLSKGFGYVEFETTEVAQSAIDDLHQQLFEGRRLMVSFARTNASQPRSREQGEHKPLNPPSKTLFIGNMSFEMTDRDLNNLFRGIRNVIDVRVAIDRRTGQPRGFAHADFVDVKSAMEAMKVLAGKENYGRALRVDYSYGPSTAPRNTPR